MPQYYQVPNLRNYDVRRLARKSLKGKWERALLPMILITLAMILPMLVQEWELFRSGILNIDTVEGVENFVRNVSNAESSVLSSILSFFSFLCTGALSISAAALSIRVLRNEKITVKNAFIGFYHFVQGFLIDFLKKLFSFFWGLVTIFPGMMIFMMCCRSSAFMVLGAAVLCITVILYVYIMLRYSMVYYIAQDNRRLPSIQVISYSVRLMKGRAGKYFLLQFSFIGWILLSSIPMGAGFLFMLMGSEVTSVPLRMIGLCLVLIGMLTVSMVQLYINTADGVFYSAISGNFGLADPVSKAAPAQAVQEPVAEMTAPAENRAEEPAKSTQEIPKEAPIEEIPMEEIPVEPASEESEPIESAETVEEDDTASE